MATVGSKIEPPPEWMKIRLKFATPEADQAGPVRELVNRSRVATVCEEASCPNLSHCWSRGSATFMIMGERCTRRCKFCDVATARPDALDPDEPRRLAETIRDMRLKHAVITSVDRDDLKDCGSTHFAAVIRAVRAASPDTTIEVLIPDFKGRLENLERIWAEGPHIINHNVETVPSLYKTICPQSNYGVSLDVLRLSAERGFHTKSGIILGLGETLEEVRAEMSELRQNRVEMLTIGQYLQPTPEHAPVMAYIPPEVFEELKTFGYELGFRHVESGPLVRSSFHAGDAVDKILSSPVS